MLVGKGLVSSVFKKKYENNNDIIIFASGVSNSKETRTTEFEREIKLLENYIQKAKLFVYFSTTSIYDPHLKGNSYTNHKLNIEEIVREKSINYLIIRASNLVGSNGNKANVLNYFYNKVISNEAFNLWSKAKRNLLDIDDFYEIVDNIIVANAINKTYNVCNLKSETVQNIIEQIESHTKLKANYTFEDLGGEVGIDTKNIEKFISSELDKKITSADYLKTLLNKYYAQ